METILQWLNLHGVSAAYIAVLLAIWASVRPRLVRYLDALGDQIEASNKHELLLMLVRAAEQTMGEASGSQKKATVSALAQEAGHPATSVEIEAAVYEAKGPVATAAEGTAVRL